MYNLIEYSDNYSDTSGILWKFKRDETVQDVDLTLDANHIPNNLSSFKYKSSFVTNRNGVKITVPLKYLSRFWKLNFHWNRMKILYCLAKMVIQFLQ